MVTPGVLARARELTTPTLQKAVQFLEPHMSLISSYQFGWVDADGHPAPASGGKTLRPALAILSAEAAGADAEVGVPAAAAVELVHNFSLLHDDVMDRDVERRHRPTAWTIFGTEQTILAGNALLILAVQVLQADGAAGSRAMPCLLSAVQELITGQSGDLRLAGTGSADLDACLAMEAGKTASLLACAASLGALAADAPADLVAALAGFGHELGMSFQLVDDVLGITGDPAVTGKSSSSDVRAGKGSAPIAAALADGGSASRQLAALLDGGTPQTDAEVARATELILAAGGVAWATAESDRRLALALDHLERVRIPSATQHELAEIADYLARREV